MSCAIAGITTALRICPGLAPRLRATLKPSGIDAAAGRADVKAAARAAIAEIEARLAEKQAQLRQDFPRYVELANPKPLSLPDAKALLGNRQALVLFLDVPQIGWVPEETVVFVLTRIMHCGLAGVA